MSKYKDVIKNGWHPEKSSSGSGSGSGSGSRLTTSSSKLGVRNKVGSMMGRDNNKYEATDRALAHQSAPISSLKDPSSFAPPPKRTGTGLAPPPPKSTAKRKVITGPSKWQDPHGPPVAAPEQYSTDPALEEYYAEHNPDALRAGQANGSHQLLLEDGSAAGAEQEKPRGPYQVNTTGLSTDHLPPPPGRRDGANVRSPPSYEAAIAAPTTRPVPAAPKASSGPSLPPRLPPRMGSRSPPKQEPSPANNGGLNQGAMNRLGAAGISVPGLGIGGKSPVSASASPPPPPRPAAPTPNTMTGAAQVNALSNRFSNLKTSSSGNPSEAAAGTAASPGQGTSWAQKQAALKTASSFHKDPSSVSFSDAKAAASTANNFRQRHGDQVAAGWNKANEVNSKFGLTNRAGGLTGSQGQPAAAASPGGGGTTTAAAAAASMAGIIGKKKPPPPPPVGKKPAAFAGAGRGAANTGSAGEDDAPPPIPLSTRPNF